MKSLFRLSLLGVAAAAAQPAAAQPATQSDPVVVTASRLDVGLPGSSTTIIDAEEIRTSPARSLPELLGREAGVQIRDLYGNTAASRATIDMRGFGAAAVSNTLVLLDGRRLNDIDVTAIDFAGIPLESIERIEVIRGNSAAVLYGDGAVGGAINIITKPAYQRDGGRLEATVGSDAYRQLDGSYGQTVGAFSANIFGSYVETDGYRENNELRQRNLLGEVRRRGDSGDIFFRLGLDDQKLGLPGVRAVFPNGVNELESERRGATTPFDHAEQNGINAVAGLTRNIADGAELILDFGVRRDQQKGTFISAFGSAFDQFVDTDLTTWSATPRLVLDYLLGGFTGNSIVGIDYYYADYNSDRKNNEQAPPFHRYDAWQQSLAVYAQNTLALAPSTDLSFGLRGQYVDVRAGDQFDPTAPGGAFGTEDQSLDQSDTQLAANLGLDHRVTERVALFGRVAHSFRVPTIDERIGAEGTSLDLKTQTSNDLEVGARYETAAIRLQSSVYVMDLRNEIHFDPNVNFGTNINLDPTRRYGVENSANWQVAENVRLKGALAYARAQFTEGPFDGNDVPLVAPWTASASVYWDILRDLTLSASVRYVSDKRLDNDQANFQPKIDDYTLVDVKLSGRYGRFLYSVAVNNLFDVEYFNYGVASATTLGRYNAYPLPGRTFLVRGGIEF